MSQVSIIDIEGNHPQIPTEFIANIGTAIPIANQLEILGDIVAAGSTPVYTTGSGNTITTNVQLSQAIAATDIANVGLSAFDSADFTVDANGFVSLVGSSTQGIDAVNVDSNTAPGTDPVVPNISGEITVTGGQVASGIVGANVIRSNSLAANSYTIEVQRSSAQAASTISSNGVSHFDSADFSVDANGFVSANGTGIGQTITGDSGGAISPIDGNWNIVGSGSTTVSGSGSTLTAQLTGLTNHNVLIGAGTATITKLAPSATSGVPLISQGASSDPAFGTAVVAGGGTGVVTITGLVSGNGTSNFVGRTITGTANQVTVTNGSGATANPTLSLPSTIHTNISFDGGSNTLNAYSTGTWTPSVSSNGIAPTVTLDVNRGTYVKIGRLCYLSALITFSAYSSAGASGQLTIGGLPFDPANDFNFPLGSANLADVSYVGNYTYVQVQDVGGTSVLIFGQGAPSSNNGGVTVDKFTAASGINFAVCYRTV